MKFAVNFRGGNPQHVGGHRPLTETVKSVRRDDCRTLAVAKFVSSLIERRLDPLG
jgi:hypothetical protein